MFGSYRAVYGLCLSSVAKLIQFQAFFKYEDEI